MTAAWQQVKMALTPREEEAAEYLKTHKIPELFDNMISELVFHRPG